MKKLLILPVIVFSLCMITFAATTYSLQPDPNPNAGDTGFYPSISGYPVLYESPARLMTAQSLDLTKMLDIGGQTRSVVIKDTFAFANEGRRLVILDISTASQPQFVTNIELGESVITDIYVDGSLAYIGTELSGTFIVDVSTPQTPFIAGHLPAPENVSVYDVLINGHYAYVAEGSAGLSIFDIQDPGNPVSVYQGDSLIYYIQTRDQYFYYTDGKKLVVLDISNPVSPQFVTEYPLIYNNSAMIYLHENQLFIMDNDSLRILNVSNPDSINEIGSIQITGGYPYDVKVKGDTAYVADYYFIDIIDLSDPGNPQFLGRQNVPGLPVRIDVTGDYAYLACYNANVKVFDCSDAAFPHEVSAWIGLVPTANSIKIKEDRAFITTAESGMSILDIADSADPKLLGKYTTVNKWYNAVGLLNNVALIGDVDTLHIVDVTNPAAITPVTDFPVVSGMISDIHIQEPYVFLASGSKGFDVLNMTDPAQPQEIGNVDTPGEALNMAISENHAYLADGSSGLRVIDISTPDSPTEVASLTLSNVYDIAVAGDFAFVGKRWSSFVHIIDISSPTNPVISDSIQIQLIDPLSVYIHNNTLFVAGSYGIQGFDISNPAHPVENINFKKVSSWVWDMTVKDEYLFVANAGMGLEVYKIPIPWEFTGLLVTNTKDSGEGSLRDALNQANNNAGSDSIRFQLPESDPNYNSSTGVWTIKPATQFPTITDHELFIEGLSQTDFTHIDNNPDGPEIEIDGSLLQSGTCFNINAKNCEISGLAITRFSHAAILGNHAEGLKVWGCYLGIDAKSSAAAPNQYGIYLLQGSFNAHIGPSENHPFPNVISGNNETGIFISDSSRNNTIIGNIIGLNKNADQKIGNVYTGIAIQDKADSNRILENRISGNRTGIVISGCTDCLIMSNNIGTNDIWELDLGNDEYGINIMSYSKRNEIIENIIAYNGKSGILVNGQTCMYNKISRNGISKNVDKGIKLVYNSNGNLAPPLLASKTAIEISGTTVPGAVVELFCDENNQGQIFMDETIADENGHFTIPLPNNPPLPRYSATATDTSGNTSEFSGTLPTSIDQKHVTELPAEHTLSQNYPNPFNPVTTIRYGLPISEVVTLKVFNVLGNEVAVLLDRVRQQAGWYNYEFDAGSLASGLYFYKLETPKTSFVRKMLYVK